MTHAKKSIGAMRAHLSRTLNRIAVTKDKTELRHLREMEKQQRKRIREAHSAEHPMAASNARIASRFAVPAAELPGGGTSHLILDDDIDEAGEVRSIAVSPHERAILDCVREIDDLQQRLTKATERMQRLIAKSLGTGEDS